MNIFDARQIDVNRSIPKYQQIVDSIIHSISYGNLKICEKIPSINNFSEEFNLSRDTLGKAYNTQKKRKIISSINEKGYYTSRTKHFLVDSLLI